MEKENTIIKPQDLEAAAQKGMDEFLDVFAQAYLSLGNGEITAEVMQQLNGDQITLLAYHVFHEEMMDGGFCQLIQNGYGPFIFKSRISQYSHPHNTPPCQ